MDQPSVLLVDDDRSTLQLCQRILTRGGFTVTALSDPRQALTLLDETSVDMLITDIRMPVMDGFELIDSAKLRQPDMAVMVMTGFGSVETAIQAVHRGADGLILKPFASPGELQQTAHKVLSDVRRRQDATRIELLRPLFDLTAAMLADTSLSSLEVRVMDAMEQVLRVQHCAVYALKDGDESRAQFVTVMNRSMPETTVPAWRKLLRFLTKRRDQVLVLQPTTLTFVEQRLLVQEIGWNAFLAAGFVHGDTLYLFTAARGIGQGLFSASDEELFTILGRQSLVALDNARLYTDLRDSLAAIEESNRALVQAEKMAAVGRVMASLAHEINNPLQAVRNCLHLAMRDEVPAEKKATYLSLANNELDRLVTTIRQMLDFYRPGQKSREHFHLHEALSNVMALMKSQFETQFIQVEAKVPENLPAVYGFRDQLQQVFFNLLINSMDAMEGLDEKHVWIDAFESGDMVKVVIEDTGKGIAPEMQSRLFEPFATTKSLGTGLGLSVSYGIIESLGGQLINIPPRRGNGACFEVHIPINRME